jgi:outer membrane protein assembly factor BamE (lipoprotein component of BamABCDE complex)
MMMQKLVMLCASALLLMSGCATDPASGSRRNLGEADFRGLKPGVTTQAEVVKLVGTPVQKTNFERLGEETWDYRYVNGSVQMLAWVVFDAQGKYKYHVAQPDPAYTCLG